MLVCIFGRDCATNGKARVFWNVTRARLRNRTVARLRSFLRADFAKYSRHSSSNEPETTRATLARLMTRFEIPRVSYRFTRVT